MLLSVFKIDKSVKNKKDQKQLGNIQLKAVHDHFGGVYEIDKMMLCTAAQMLQTHEFTNLLNNKHIVLKITNHGDNCFSLNSSLLAYNTDALLTYLNQQRIPYFTRCVEVSKKTQHHFGFLPFKTNISQTNETKSFIDDAFLSDNATTISKLTDMLNENLKTNLYRGANIAGGAHKTNKTNTTHTTEQPTLVYSHSHAAKQLRLAATFCSTAWEDQACMWHISQGMISDFNKEAQTKLYDGVEPEKHHVTILLKGNTVEERIMRINLAVRIFPKDHIFTKQIMPTMMPINSSSCHTSVMVLTGVNSQVAAAMYVNSESTANNNMNNIALNAYLHGPAQPLR